MVNLPLPEPPLAGLDGYKNFKIGQVGPIPPIGHSEFEDDTPDDETKEIRTTSSTGAEKGVKPEAFALIPVEALEEIARLYGNGAKKYAAHNWRAGYEFSKSYSALQRHANAFWRGEDIDPEMGVSHMACVAFHAMALITFVSEHPEFDDRYKK